MAVNPPITRDELRSLALHRAPSAMTTCYLDVDGRRFLKPQDLQRSVEVVLRRARAEAGTDRSRMADIDRIAEFVRQGIDRSRTRGLAFFSHHGEGFWKVVALARTGGISQAMHVTGLALGLTELGLWA